MDTAPKIAAQALTSMIDALSYYLSKLGSVSHFLSISAGKKPPTNSSIITTASFIGLGNGPRPLGTWSEGWLLVVSVDDVAVVSEEDVATVWVGSPSFVAGVSYEGEAVGNKYD